jgi:SHS2 domain-containing protein
VRYLAHTADVGLEAEGRSLEECFARSAAGMFATFLGPAPSEPAPDLHFEDVEVQGEGLEEVLVAWLEEALYLFEVRHLAPSEFEVREVSPDRLLGRLGGRPHDLAAEPEVGPAVKGVTRHQLKVERLDGRWRATVYFDV